MLNKLLQIFVFLFKNLKTIILSCFLNVLLGIMLYFSLAQLFKSISKNIVGGAKKTFYLFGIKFFEVNNDNVFSSSTNNVNVLYPIIICCLVIFLIYVIIEIIIRRIKCIKLK